LGQPVIWDVHAIAIAMDASTNLQLALLSAAVLGFRHGFDYDHIAADQRHH